MRIKEIAKIQNTEFPTWQNYSLRYFPQSKLGQGGAAPVAKPTLDSDRTADYYFPLINYN